MEFLHSVEFYVIVLLVAALAVGLLAMPSGHGPVETDFSEGFLSYNPDMTDLTPRIELEALGDGSVKISRYGLPEELGSTAAVALAITRKGFDLTVEERITPSSRALPASETAPVNMAVYIINGLARERYHLKFNSDSTSSFTALTFMNRPGLRSTRLFHNA